MTDQIKKKLILTENDIKLIDYSIIDHYDFSGTPNKLRNIILGNYLAHCYLEEYNRHYKKTRKSLSQNMYAQKVLKISPMGFSTYKNGERIPTGENLENLANHLGLVIYDILGLPWRIPDDKELKKLVEMWPRLLDHEKKEILKIIINFINHHDE
jgi:hypothetical protein